MTLKKSKKIPEEKRQSIIRDYIIMALVAALAAAILLIFPERSAPTLSASKKYFLDLLIIIPAAMIIIGLFSVWVPEEIITRYMGKASGIKGIFLSIFLGMLPTGPLYIAFPMAVVFLKKGAKISNIIIFISAWACIKLPQELIEIQFLGIRFTSLRLVLTIIFTIIMGLIIEKIILFSERKRNLKKV
jgi:uncharacterized membrane protein YraQ (UPF0718 family)